MASCISPTIWSEILSQGVTALAKQISDADAIALNEAYGTHNYKPLPVNIVRAEGAKVWDGQGRDYIDFIGAYSAVAHGHVAPSIKKAIAEQLEEVAVTSRAFHNTHVGMFLHGLAIYCDLDMVCPMNTGAEAVETCIKLARKWGYTVKGVPRDQAEIIVCQDNFHGRTTTIVGFSTEEAYKNGFGPFTPGFKVIPFGDAQALEQAITPNTVAFLAEPIQAEGGILMAEDGFLADVREICTRTNTLLIWDEIQTGFCRTGTKFAWQYEDAKPDLLAVGKPLGGGVLPVSAAVGRREVMEVFKPGDHGSTFGGNPLGSVVALTALAEMEVKDYAGRARDLGAMALDYLSRMTLSQVIDIRGRGLLIGIEVDETVDTKALSQEFMKNGVLTKETRNRTFRLTPPIATEEDVLMDGLERVRKSLEAVCR